MARQALLALRSSGSRVPRLGAENRTVSDLETVTAAISYRETGDPFASDEAARPKLRIGLCSSLSWGFLRDLIRRVRAEPDAAALSFLEGTTHEIVEATIRGEVDIGFAYGLHDLSQLQYEALWREPLMVLMPDHHPLASESDVHPEALRDEIFLVAGDPTERDLQIDFLERSIGGTPSTVLVVPVERSTVIDLVSLGFGLALTPGSALGAFHPGVSYRPIAAPVEPIAFHAIWRRSNRNPELVRFLDTARALAAGRRG